MLSRRDFLAAAVAGSACSQPSAEDGDASRIESIERSVVWDGEKNGFTWFHPRPCRVPDGLLMAVQDISGSDVFGPVHWSASADGGRGWSEPEPIPGLERLELPNGNQEAICDTVPQYHPATESVIFLGWNVYYKDNKLTLPNEQRWPVYVVRRADGSWTPRSKLDWDHPAAARIYGSNCSQRLTLPDGDVLIPLTFASYERTDRVVGTVLCSFNGERLSVKRTGNFLELAVERGLLEPSITRFGDVFHMTIRAEDGRGYVSSSADGLEWGPIKPWTWDDSEPLEMSTTQQHWLTRPEALYLVYTRKTSENAEVMRWRSPLLTARVDPKAMTLVRETETVLLPLRERDKPNLADAARLGNFHPVDVSPEESIVLVGEARPKQDWRGDTLQARIRWRAAG